MTQQVPVFMGATEQVLLTTAMNNVDTVLRTSRTFLVECSESPSVGSPLAVEQHTDPYSYAWTAGWQTLMGAQDHLEGLIGLVTSGRGVTRFAPYTLTRGALEGTARAWWMFDREVTPDERLARGFGARLHAVDQRIKLRNPAASAALAARRASIVSEAASFAVVPRVRLGMTDLLILLHPGGPPGAMLEPGRLAYHVLSGYSHAEMWALMLGGMRIPGTSQGDVTTVAVTLNVGFLTTFIDLALSTYDRVIEDVCVLAGRPTKDWHAARGASPPAPTTPKVADEPDDWVDV